MAHQKQNDLNRRGFLKGSISAIAASATGLVTLSPLARMALAANPPMLAESDPTATALGYKADASKVDVKKWAKKAAADGKTQSCANCMFYTSIDKKTGKCQIFPNNSVAAGGWCNTWSKKA